MSDNPNEVQGSIDIHLEDTEFSVAPGGSVTIPLVLINQEATEDSFRLTVQGVPTSWVSTPVPSVLMSPGEQKKVSLVVQPPKPPQSRAGRYMVTIQAISQGIPGQMAEADITLTVAAFEVQGRVGLLMETTQFSVAPGSSITIPIVLLNQGLVEDHFRLTVKGIPAGWVSTPSPVTRMAPGDEKEVSLIIQPSRTHQSRAGRARFKIQVVSQQEPDQIAEVDCSLTVAAFTQFDSKLDPERLEAGQVGQVGVANQGNIQGTFSLTWQSEADSLVFETVQPGPPDRPDQAKWVPLEAGQSQTVRVPAGQVASVAYRAKPRSRNWFGSEMIHHFKIQVAPTEKDVQPQTLGGEVISRGLIPIWVLPVLLVVCLALVCVSYFLINRTQPQEASATQTAGLTLTAQIAGTQTASANQTAAAIIGEEDTDGDGLTNREELEIGTDPTNPDTDGDELFDGAEVKTYTTDPLNPDTDADGLSDGEEVLRRGTDPKNPDTDADELSDGEEVIRRSTDPKNPDTDADELSDGEEVIRQNTDPLNPDTDQDELKDGAEVRLGTNPLNPDTDNDRLLDGKETPPCPDPLNPDTDGDGIIDGLDLDPCDPTNPSLTATAVAGQPTPEPPTEAPIFTPTEAPPGATTQVPTEEPGVPTETPSPPSIPGTILFQSDRGGNPEIYLASSGAEPQQLTISPGIDTHPAWSPDGGRIAFTSNRDGNNEIYVMNADGTAQRNVSNNPADDQFPTWSPDGQWIAFSSNRDGNQEIYFMRADGDGSDAQNLTNNPANDSQPRWFTDKGLFVSTGEWIAFTSDRDGNQEVYRMNADGTDPVNMTNNPAQDFSPCGLPGARRIAFTTNRDGNLEVYTMDIDGKDLINVSKNPADDQYPAWSGDGAWIAFMTNRDGNLEIYVAKADGDEPFNFTNNPAQDANPAWR